MKLRVALYLSAFFHCALAWHPSMPGGLKLGLRGKIYSFTTDKCSGGVVFKKPVKLDYACSHGYFFRRPNACKMADSDIISGSNYVCTKNDVKFIQAFIPLTNPGAPLDQTFTFYDSEDSLSNLRRYTYSQGLEHLYEEANDKVLKPVGVAVANVRKTPAINMGNMCYRSKGRKEGAAIVASLPSDYSVAESSGQFTKSCKENNIEFPWDKVQEYSFNVGYSKKSEFEHEIPAVLPKDKTSAQNDLSEFEIWDGLAYCLQTKEETHKGKIQQGGLIPSIEVLAPVCREKALSRQKRTANLPSSLPEAQESNIASDRRKRQDAAAAGAPAAPAAPAGGGGGGGDGYSGLALEMVRLGPGELPNGFQFASIINCVKICLPRPLPVKPLPAIWTE